MRFVGAGFLVGAVVAFALAFRGVAVEYRASDFLRAGITQVYAERQAARANSVARSLAHGTPIARVVAELEAAFAVPWYASGRGPGEDSFPLRPRVGLLTQFVARDPNSLWYRRAVRGMTYDGNFVGRRPARYLTHDGLEVFAGELVEDRAGVTFRTGTDERSTKIVADAWRRLEALAKADADTIRRELAVVLRGYALASPYGERTAAFAEALVLGAHLAFVGEVFHVRRDLRADVERAAWTTADGEDFGVETGFVEPAEPRRRLSHEDGGV